jgi:hypothetical protein
MDKQIEDFINFLKNIKIPEEKYYITYDESGKIISLEPDILTDTKNRIEIDRDLAYSFYDGNDSIMNYYVDTIEKKLHKIDVLTLVYGLRKISDLLYKIPNKKWSEITDPDISIVYKNKIMSITMKESLKTKTIEGETDLIFFITDYNDPNMIKEIINVNAGDLVESDLNFTLDIEGKFSIYTRKVFENYSYENC